MILLLLFEERAAVNHFVKMSQESISLFQGQLFERTSFSPEVFYKEVVRIEGTDDLTCYYQSRSLLPQKSKKIDISLYEGENIMAYTLLPNDRVLIVTSLMQVQLFQITENEFKSLASYKVAGQLSAKNMNQYMQDEQVSLIVLEYNESQSSMMKLGVFSFAANYIIQISELNKQISINLLRDLDFQISSSYSVVKFQNNLIFFYDNGTVQSKLFNYDNSLLNVKQYQTKLLDHQDVIFKSEMGVVTIYLLYSDRLAVFQSDPELKSFELRNELLLGQFNYDLIEALGNTILIRGEIEGVRQFIIEIHHDFFLNQTNITKIYTNSRVINQLQIHKELALIVGDFSFEIIQIGQAKETQAKNFQRLSYFASGSPLRDVRIINYTRFDDHNQITVLILQQNKLTHTLFKLLPGRLSCNLQGDKKILLREYSPFCPQDKKQDFNYRKDPLQHCVYQTVINVSHSFYTRKSLVWMMWMLIIGVLAVGLLLNGWYFVSKWRSLNEISQQLQFEEMPQQKEVQLKQIQ